MRARNIKNLSGTLSVAGVMMVLTNKGWFAVDSGTVLKYLNI